jgi:tellurite resistance protein TehA-like permease
MTLSAFCTWLIPLLLALGVWRHVLRRLPLRYETSLWSVVFSLGMYAVASRSLGDASGRHWLADAGRIEIWPAVAVWAAVFAAMLVAPARPVRPPRPPHGSTAAG